MALDDVRHTPDTPIPVDELHARARAIGQTDLPAATLETRIPCLAFAAGGEWFALPLASVLEVLRGLRVVPIPHTPIAVRGVVNRRGDIVPVIDLAVLAGSDAATGGEAVVVVGHEALVAGLLVDGWPEIVDIETAAVMPLPHQSRFVGGVYRDGERSLKILVPEPLIDPGIYRLDQVRRTTA